MLSDRLYVCHVCDVLWPNGWLDQDSTWYGGIGGIGLGPGHIVLDGDPVPQFSAHVCCGQMSGWIKMPLGTKVGRGPGDTVRWGQSLPQKGAQQPPLFGPFLV